jgi:hypothetical protein
VADLEVRPQRRALDRRRVRTSSCRLQRRGAAHVLEPRRGLAHRGLIRLLRWADPGASGLGGQRAWAARAVTGDVARAAPEPKSSALQHIEPPADPAAATILEAGIATSDWPYGTSSTRCDARAERGRRCHPRRVGYATRGHRGGLQPCSCSATTQHDRGASRDASNQPRADARGRAHGAILGPWLAHPIAAALRLWWSLSQSWVFSRPSVLRR